MWSYLPAKNTPYTQVRFFWGYGENVLKTKQETFHVKKKGGNVHIRHENIQKK
jgi:hypothetical protein